MRMPVWTTFPHSNYPTLNGLMDKLNDLYEQDPDKAPKIVSIRKGTSQGDYNSAVVIRYPMKMIGAVQDKAKARRFFLTFLVYLSQERTRKERA